MDLIRELIIESPKDTTSSTKSRGGKSKRDGLALVDAIPGSEPSVSLRAKLGIAASGTSRR